MPTKIQLVTQSKRLHWFYTDGHDIPAACSWHLAVRQKRIAELTAFDTWTKT
jgi:hypothetical protein